MHLRTFVQGGGCSGFQYGFTFDQEIEQDDFVVELGQYKLLVDAMSMTYLSECTIDFVENLEGANFVIKNPAATSTCGCGNSFSI
jgi:iron-sulfur cluster insertion protein